MGLTRKMPADCDGPVADLSGSGDRLLTHTETSLTLRQRRNLFLQKIFWTKPGFLLLRRWLSLCKRVDHVLFNYSLESKTNGEMWLLDSLPRAPVVLDVGFHRGSFSRKVLSKRPAAKVYAFDPARSAAAAWEHDPFLRGNVSFLCMALSNTNTVTTFHDYGTMCSSLAQRVDVTHTGISYDVQVGRLDDWCRDAGIEEIHLLKIDAEGFDLHVMEGAEHMLRQARVDVILFEYADGWISSQRFLQEADHLLTHSGYLLCRLFNGFLLPLRYSTDKERFDHPFMGVAISQRIQQQEVFTVRDPRI